MSELNEILKNDGVIAFPTDTVWGVGCLPSNKNAVDKIYELKGRDRSKPLILMSDEIEFLYPYIKNIPLIAIELIKKHFPGALTLIFEKSDLTPDFVTSGFNTVGIRLPNHKKFKEICTQIDGHVLATTSANLSNEPPALTFKEAKKTIGKEVDLVIEDHSDNFHIFLKVVSVVNVEIKIFR